MEFRFLRCQDSLQRDHSRPVPGYRDQDVVRLYNMRNQALQHSDGIQGRRAVDYSARVPNEKEGLQFLCGRFQNLRKGS